MIFNSISINGKLVETEEEVVSVNDLSFYFGIGAITTFRSSERKVFLLDEHLKRLEKTLSVLRIKNFNRHKTIGFLENLIGSFNAGQDLFIRLMIASGRGELKLTSQKFENPNIIIYASKIDKLRPINKTAKILKSSKRQVPEYFESTGFRMKTSDYLSSHIAQKELTSNEEGILLSSEGYVCEALTSNLFWTKNSQIYTPPLSLGILPGIIRSFLIKNLAMQEKLIKTDELFAADEVFLTNSVNYLIPIKIIDSHEKPGVRGHIFSELYKKFN